MKKKIAILGSTGSIGKTLVEIIKKDKINFEVVLLSADENYKELLKQAKFFKTKIKFLKKRPGERYASALTNIYLTNKVYKYFGKNSLKNYIDNFIKKSI